jgi:hypothetical protein
LLCDGHLGWVGDALIGIERGSDLLADEAVTGRVIEVRASGRAQPAAPFRPTAITRNA